MAQQHGQQKAPSREQGKPYDASDIEVVMRQGDWRNWDDVIEWLQKEGDNHRRLRTDEVRQMVDDFRRLKEKGKPFTNDPNELARLLGKA